MRILTALLLVSSVALGQVNTTKKITFKEGETQKIGVNISGLTSITRVEVTFRNSLNAIVRKFSTVDTTITLSDTLYTFSFTDLQSVGKAGRGTWQVEVRSEEGVKKTDVYTYEIFKAATLTGSTTPAYAGGYNYLFQWDFEPTTPTFDVIASGIIVVDNVSISSALSAKSDTSHAHPISKVTGLQSTLDTKVDAAGVRATTLTGLSTASATAVTSADNILAATGKLQAQATSNRQVADLAFLEAGTTADAEAKPILSPDNPPLYVFSVNNNTATKARQVVNTLYLDNLFNANVDVSIDGRGSTAINPVVSGSKIINLISSTYDIVSTAINNLVTAVASVTAQVRYMPIGDSITADEHLDVSGNNRDYWNYSSKAVYNILRDRVDASNAFAAPVLIGHGNFKTRSFTYKGNSLTNRGGNAAQSGWAGSNYLYHASRLTGIVTGLSGFVPPDVSYHLLGLQTAGNGAWAATTAQQELIRTTIQGKNTCDKNATLYNWMKVQPGWGGANDTYTGSGTQHTNMDTFATYLLDNPGNPFYSKTKAQTGGSTNAFSLTTYLSRYKTLADDGTTRLTVGSTAGTLVSNATAYDVCTPTHVTISFGENDFYLFPATTATQVATVMRTIANVIATEYPAIKIGLLTNPRPGTNFPKLFPDGVRYAKSTTLTKSQLRNALITNLGVTSSVTKASGTSIYYVPTYEVTYPLSHMFDTYAETAGSQIDMEETVISTSHLGLDAQASLGDAVYAWLYYSLFN